MKRLLPTNVAWLMRLWVALLLFFVSEVILWTNPPGRHVREWALVIIAYVVFSAMLLDVMQRYRIANVSGLLFVAGLYALLAALIINPETTLLDVPRTIATRVLGAHTFVAWVILSFMLMLTGGQRRRSGVLLVGITSLAGLGWGVWVRQFPLESEILSTEVALETMLGWSVPVILAILVLFIVLFHNAKHISADDLRLTTPLWIGHVLIAAGLLFNRFDSAFHDDTAMSIVFSLIIFAGLVIWFQHQPQRRTLLDRRLPIRPLFPPWIVLALTSFVGLGAVGYGLPREVVGIDLLSVLTVLFTLFGILWLPVVSVMLGLQALQQQVRSDDI